MNDRRNSPRYKAVDGRVWAGWWARPEEFVASASLVENISLGGARILMTNPPWPSQNLWIRLGDSSLEQFVQGAVLEVSATERGEFWVRLAFDSACPDLIFSTILALDSAELESLVPS